MIKLKKRTFWSFL